MDKVWINRRFVDAKDATVPVTDRGFLYGDGVFETMRAYAGIVFDLDGHLDRLFGALRAMRIRPPYTKAALKDAVYALMRVNKLAGAYIRLAVTRGEGRFGITYKDAFTPNVVIVAKDFEGYPAWMHEKGIRAKIVTVRQNEFSPLARIKSGNFLPYVLGRFEAKDDGYDEAILLNTAGDVAEASTGNIFIVKRGALVTPSVASGVLPGITRRTVIGIARQLKIRVSEKRVARAELFRADEAFLTNSLAEVIPVVRVDGKRIGAGRPGPFTRLLHLSYQKRVIENTLHG